MFHFGVIPGDWAGKIRTKCALTVLEQLSRLHGFMYQLETFDLGADRYIEYGELITKSQLSSLSTVNGILLGGFSDPRLERSICEKGITARIWSELNLFVTMAFVHAFSVEFCPLKGHRSLDIDFVVIYENMEDGNTDIGSFIHKNTSEELALTQGVYIRKTI